MAGLQPVEAKQYSHYTFIGQLTRCLNHPIMNKTYTNEQCIQNYKTEQKLVNMQFQGAVHF
jgi:hypothetical protein